MSNVDQQLEQVQIELYFAKSELKRLKMASTEGLNVRVELEHAKDKVSRLEESEFELLTGVSNMYIEIPKALDTLFTLRRLYLRKYIKSNLEQDKLKYLEIDEEILKQIKGLSC